jgi:flavin reductase (DIM6/NTAB) family NADH-FMN oxidoreductase RutF
MKRSIGPKTLAYPLPAYLIGSYDENRSPNVMTAAWGGVLCSDPPLLGFCARPTRMTYDGVLKHKAFTINFPSAKMAVQVDFAGLTSGRQVNKFALSGLTPIESPLVEAPYIEEAPVVTELKLFKYVELGTHTLFVGQIMDVRADISVINEDGSLDILKIDPIIYSGVDYHRVGELLGKAFNIGKRLIRPMAE